MRIFAISDLHVDYDENATWVGSLSLSDFQHDALIVAGDISDVQEKFSWCIEALTSRFKTVMFVPGNHDVWVIREKNPANSLDKFHAVLDRAKQCGAHTSPFDVGPVTLIPLFAWYDHSFAARVSDLEQRWTDCHACRWPNGMTDEHINHYFLAMNDHAPRKTEEVISFSHFVPRIDVMPAAIPTSMRWLYSVLGSALIDKQIRQLGARMHVYGHSHVNRRVVIDGVTYINNAFGYPHERHITSKKFVCIREY